MSIEHKMSLISFVSDFNGKHISEDEITNLLKVLRFSGIRDEETFKVMVIHHPPLQSQLDSILDKNISLQEASHLFIFSLPRSSNLEYIQKAREEIYMALYALILAAQDFHIDIAIIEDLEAIDLREVLDLEEDTLPVVLLALGYRKNNKDLKKIKAKDLSSLVQLRY